MKLLCRLGFHYWKLLGFTNMMMSDSLEQCRNCGIGRQLYSYGQAYTTIPAAQMAERQIANQKN